MIEYRADLIDGRYVVAFGQASFAAIDGWGLHDHARSQKAQIDRQFYHTAIAEISRAAEIARLGTNSPYGGAASAKRRKLCELIASIANKKRDEQ